MKTNKLPFLKPILIERLVWAGLIAVLSLTLSCNKDRAPQVITCGPDGPPTAFVNQTGTMKFVADANCWTICFLPDCLIPNNIDTEYFAFIKNYPMPEELMVDGKAVKFSGSIQTSDYKPDWTLFCAGTEFYDLNLTAIQAK